MDTHFSFTFLPVQKDEYFFLLPIVNHPDMHSDISHYSIWILRWEGVHLMRRCLFFASGRMRITGSVVVMLLCCCIPNHFPMMMFRYAYDAASMFIPATTYHFPFRRKENKMRRRMRKERKQFFPIWLSLFWSHRHTNTHFNAACRPCCFFHHTSCFPIPVFTSTLEASSSLESQRFVVVYTLFLI